MSKSKSDASPPGAGSAAAPAAPRPRRTQAERSESTRGKLIDATTKLLRVRGYGGLRTVEVSEVAGVSRGAQLHHFPTKNDLVIATAQHLNEAMVERSRQRMRNARAGADPIDALIEDACDFFFGDYFFITLAINQSDERNEELLEGIKPYMAPSRLQVEREWLSVLEDAGLPRDLATDVLTLTLSVVRGYGVRTLLVETADRFSREVALWRQIIGEHVRGRLEGPGRAPGQARLPATDGRPERPIKPHAVSTQPPQRKNNQKRSRPAPAAR